MASPIPVPEGTPVKRTLHFFWLTDYSGSMSGAKISTLNHAIREALPELRQAVTAHPEVQIMMQAIKFADSASWHVGPTAVSLEQFVWPELRIAGTTATAQAIRMLAAGLTTENMPRRGYPPVCILVSDGHCTDPPEAYDRAIAELLNLPWGSALYGWPLPLAKMKQGTTRQHCSNSSVIRKLACYKRAILRSWCTTLSGPVSLRQ